jgi:hypothetical protein
MLSQSDPDHAAAAGAGVTGVWAKCTLTIRKDGPPHSMPGLQQSHRSVI